MLFSVSNRTPAKRALALASAISTCFIPFSLAHAQEDKSLPPVVVTAARFASTPADLPIGSTVITADEIRTAGIDNVNLAVRKLGGVYGRQGSYGTQDYDLDLRGFGVNSAQNVVVLLDGIRLSENEQAVALLSSIPIDMVDRIEIVRGGSSVLYGDGATGGVIHVITKRGFAGTQGSVIAEAGQFDHRSLRAFAAKGWDGFSVSANASRIKTDNYRDNNAVDLDNFGASLQWAASDIRVGLRADAVRQDSRLPGDLTLAQFNADPRQTLTPNDRSSIDTDRIVAFAERRFGPWEVAAELSHREKRVDTYMYSSASQYDSRQTQFSPRLRHRHNMAGGMSNEFVAGVDFTSWERDTDSSYSLAEARQWSRAAYLRDELKWGKARVAAGVRHESFDQKSNDPAPYTYADYRKRFSVNAWELQGSYAPSAPITLFAKAGQSYRVANVDDNAFTPVEDQPLKPQISHDLELGASMGDKANKLSVKVFQHRLRNEIFYDPIVANPNSYTGYGANVNLDPTRRQGIEIEGSARIASAWLLTAMWQHVKAEFTDGPYEGREMVMVPKNIVSARLSWLPAQGHTAALGVQWVDEQRYGGDFANTCSARIPSYAVWDARYAWRTGPWEFAVTGENLTDKDYFQNAYGCQDGSQGGIYPNPGRQLKLSVRYDF